MVVEDDSNLRDIYSVRITAEGYDVVSAGDGEEALAVAVREKPDLILSDVMMPKISGFDMLDILRSTPETANIKVVMMTALSADDQRQRGERLGADRYLVKSQVGIEDVVNTIHEVLGDKPAGATSDPNATPDPTAGPAPVPAPETPNTAPAPEAPAPGNQPIAPAPESQPVPPVPENPAPIAPPTPPAQSPEVPANPVAPAPEAPAPAPEAPAPEAPNNPAPQNEQPTPANPAQ